MLRIPMQKEHSCKVMGFYCSKVHYLKGVLPFLFLFFFVVVVVFPIFVRARAPHLSVCVCVCGSRASSVATNLSLLYFPSFISYIFQKMKKVQMGKYNLLIFLFFLLCLKIFQLRHVSPQPVVAVVKAVSPST